MNLRRPYQACQGGRGPGPHRILAPIHRDEERRSAEAVRSQPEKKISQSFTFWPGMTQRSLCGSWTPRLTRTRRVFSSLETSPLLVPRELISLRRWLWPSVEINSWKFENWNCCCFGKCFFISFLVLTECPHCVQIILTPKGHEKFTLKAGDIGRVNPPKYDLHFQTKKTFTLVQVREVRGHGQLDFPQRRVGLLESEDQIPGQDDPHLLWPLCCGSNIFLFPHMSLCSLSHGVTWHEVYFKVVNPYKRYPIYTHRVCKIYLGIEQIILILQK